VKQEVKKCESLVYLAAAAAESTAQSCLDGRQSDMSSLPNIRKKSLRKESKTESLTKRPFSAMSEHSSVKGTPEAIKEWLILSVVDFPASHSQSQENEREAMTQEICGQQRWKLSKSSSQPMCTLRTCPDYSAQQWTTQQGDLFTTLERFSETWPKAGMTLDTEFWGLTMLEQDTTESGFGLEAFMYPTPRVLEVVEHPLSQAARLKDRTGNRANNLASMAKFELWPTPRCHDAKTMSASEMDRKSPCLGALVVYPTPSANEDAAGRPGSKMQKMLGNSPEVRGTTPEEWGKGSLNPDWVEWLMGWPQGATSLEPMSKDTYNEWLSNVETMWQQDPSEREVDPIPRVATGVENRANRLKAIGNGQVSLTMVTAYKLLESI